MEKKGLILIVEDNIVNRKLLEKLFAQEYRILEADNGEEALTLIRKYEDQLSVIILDLYMPVMDGYSVLESISRNNKWQNIPVVVATSENSVESDQRLLDLGAYTIIHKPFVSAIVKTQVVNIIEKARKQYNFMKEFLLQKALINKTENTLLCSYHYATGSLDLDGEDQEITGKEFLHLFDKVPFDYAGYVLPADLEKAARFFGVEHKKDTYDEISIRLRMDDIHYEWFRISMMIHYGEHQELDHAVFLFTNIEYEVEAKNKLTFMAMNDILTHIPNRRTFADDVREMLNRYQSEQFVMITMDFYRFHLLNKLFGYNEGDNVLRYFAIKLQEMIESYSKGVYCRMSSDIFYACISEQDDIEEFITTLQESLRSYPINFDLKVYFGIYPIKNREEAVELMIEHSAYARTEVKKEPLKMVQYYTDKLQEKEYFEAVVEAEMEIALTTKQFEVYLQPKYDIEKNEIIGSEALVRWDHPQKGFLSPAYFIPIFEQNGFITELDYYVYEMTCKTIRRWMDEGIKPLPVSVNVSRCDLYDSKLINRILETVEKYQVPTDLIEFEITESAFITENILLTGFTEKLRAKGFRVLIDDFGSGYSALNSLKDIDLDILKIDIKFLPVSENEVKSPIILASVVEMAQKLGLDVIAEGVESKEQVDLLYSLGCKNVQGFYFYRPMPIEQYEKIVLEQTEIS